jgi:hypothetical protein
MRLSGTGNTLVIKADHGVNEGARVFTGSLGQSGTATWVFDGARTFNVSALPSGYQVRHPAVSSLPDPRPVFSLRTPVEIRQSPR